MVAEISWVALSWCAIPVLFVVLIYLRWESNPSEVLVASGRMVGQLIAVGYVLIFLFSRPSPWVSLVVMLIMISAASWIAIRPVRDQRGFLKPAFTALGVSVSLHLIISLKLVMDVEPWYQPRVLIPLAGMYFANGMNAISLAAERFHSELSESQAPVTARLLAFRAAMIPQINSLLAVGLVALPGMMTGQILSGVSPLIAVRYQILIMTMILGTSGLGAALLLWQLEKRFKTDFYP